MHFADHVEVQQDGNGDGAVEGRIVNFEGRRVVHFVGADGFLVQEIGDVLFGLEFHQGGAVVFAHFGQGGAHVAQDFRVVMVLVVLPGRTAAEELAVRQQLLVHLEAASETQLGVVFGRQGTEQGPGLQQPGVGDGVAGVHGALVL